MTKKDGASVIGRRTRWLISSLFVLWTFFIFGSFFTVQKPFSVTSALAIGNVLLDLLTAGWLALIALAIGTWFLEQLLGSRLSSAEAVVFGTGLGLGALGLLSLALGLVGLFQPVIAYVITIALSAILVPQVMRLVRQWRRWRPRNPPGLLATVYLLLIAFLTVLVALLPPTDWDGLFYHLTSQKLYLQAERVTGNVDIPHLSFPALMEMLYGWAILLRGDIAAKLMHTVFGLLLAGLVYLTACRLLSQRSAWLAMLVFVSMPMVSTLAGWAYNDLALAFYQLAAMYAFILSVSQRGPTSANVESHPSHSTSPIQNLKSPGPPGGRRVAKIQNRHWLILSGIFAGLAMGLKYTSFVTPLVIGGLILWSAFRTLRTKSGGSRLTGFVDFTTFSLLVLLVALPWYVKNWVFTGNPVYPFLFDWFGGQYWDNFRADWYAAAGTGIGLRLDTLLALPWLLTLGIRDANYWDGRTGPLILLFLPLILVYGLSRYYRSTPDQPAALGPLLIYALAQFVLWTLGVVWSRSLWQSRLLLSGLVALAPVAGWIWADLPRFDLPQFSLSKFTNLAIGLTLALTVIDIGLLNLSINPLPYLVGLETREEYLTRQLGAHYAAMQEINETLPEGAVVAFLWEPRSYYCLRDCQPDSILDVFPHLVYQHNSADAIARAWQQAGVTHLLIHRSGLNFLLSKSSDAVETDILTELEIHHLRLLFDVAGAYQVYELGPAS